MLNSLKYKVSTFKNIKDFKHKTRQSFYQKIGFMKFFDLHEYQSKIILRQHGLRVQNGDLATSHIQAKEIADTLKGELIIKAQVHAGGRGKGHLTSGLKGGVKICQTSNEIENFAKQMIGYNLITKQTSKEGLPVSSVLVLESVDIKRQLYLAILLDRAHSGPVIIYSTEGGMEIEEVAEKNPEAIHFEPVDVKTGLTQEQAEKIVSKLGFETVDQKQDAVDQLKKLYSLFNRVDATQVEINPWAVDTNGKLYLVDAKINIDESASYRQNQIMEMRRNSASSEDRDPNELEGEKHGLNYIGLKGNIGCLVNGAGLAMATMDIIKLKGGDPANFLDVGGGANVDQVTKAFEILVNHPSVKTILVNIFGGIMKCDIIANGIIQAVQKVGVTIPIVIRLTGTNSKEGLQHLNEFAEKSGSKFTFITADDLDAAAEKAVSAVIQNKI